VRGLAIGVCAVAFAGSSRAADVRFTPSVDVGYYLDGNVAVVGTERESDYITRIGAALELATLTPTTSFTARYAPYQELYQDFSDNDNLSHVVSLDLSSSPSRRSEVASTVVWTRTERQPIRSERPDAPTTFLPRVRQDRGYADLGGHFGLGRTTFLEWGVTGETLRFHQSGTTTLEDSDTYGARTGFGWELAETSRAGVRIEGRKYDFETQEDSDSESLTGFWSKELGRATSLVIEVGAIRANTGDESEIAPRAHIVYDYAFQNTSTLEAGLRQDVSADTGVSGMTTDRGVYVTYRPGDRAERFDASITVYYWNREDVFDDATFHVRSFQAAESLAWYPGRGDFAVGAFHTYYDQSDVAGGTPGLDTSYHSGGVFARWTYGRNRGTRS